MPDFRRVSPGDAIPSDNQAWNSLLETSRRANNEKAGRDGMGPLGDGIIPSLMAIGQNALPSGSGGSGNLAALNVVTSQSAVIDPNVGPPLIIRQRPMLTVIAPRTTSDPVFIVADPMSNGAYGRVIVQGVTVAVVNVTSLTHQFAQPVPGVTAYLQSSPVGPVRLLTTPALIGLQNLLVMVTNQVCCPTTSGCDPCNGVFPGTSLYVGQGAGCTACQISPQMVLTYGGSIGNNWIGNAGCSVGSGTTCVCLQRVELRCVNNQYVVDVTRELFTGATGVQVTQTGLPVDLAACNPFCASFVVPPDATCAQPTTYFISSSPSFSGCGGSGSGSGSGGGSCCGGNDPPTLTCTVSNVTGGSSCLPASFPLAQIQGLAAAWSNNGPLGSCNRGGIELLCNSSGVWSVSDGHPAQDTFSIVSASCSGGNLLVVVNATFAGGGLTTTAGTATLTFTNP